MFSPQQEPYKGDAVIILTLQVRKLRPEKNGGLATRWQGQDLNKPHGTVHQCQAAGRDTLKAGKRERWVLSPEGRCG